MENGGGQFLSVVSVMDEQARFGGNRRRWPGIYILLAGFVIVTVTGSLLLNREILSIHTNSVDMNRHLAKHVSDLTHLGEMAVRTNAPGNHVFASHDIAGETRRRDRALARFTAQLNRLSRDIGGHVEMRERTALFTALTGIRDSMNDMVRKQNQGFADLKAGRTDPAGRHMAEMDRASGAVMSRIAGTIALMQSEQEMNFAAQISDAQRLRHFEILISLAIVVMVVGISLYGHRIARLMRRHHEKLERAKAKAEDANVAKTRFLAAMSHEVRTPMNGVLGTVGSLLGSGLTPEQREQALTIKESGTTLLSILDDILDLSKVEAGHLEVESVDFSVDHLIESARALWESRAQARGLDYVCHKNLGVADTIRSDPGRIRQILFNLIGNALKFTEMGRIEIHVGEERHPDGRIELRFEVRDTGIGVDQATKEELFSPFKQANSSTARNYGGTGLGLAISRELAGLLGGSIGVEPNPGGGSIFWFTVVAEQGDAANVIDVFHAKAPPTPPEDLSERPLRVLVAEDNHINQKVMKLILATLDCEADIVDTGVEAIQAVSGKAYDLILMDVQMREMDGVTATREIRGMSGPVSEIPIIALTANAMKGDREKYLEAGMNDYVSKPFEPQDLFAAISRCVGAPVTDHKVIELPTHRRKRTAS